MGSMIDRMKDKLSDKEYMKLRLEELKMKTRNGEIGSRGRSEMYQLRARLDKK